MARFDFVIVGGGLQGGLIALAVRHFQPAASVALIERGERPGGNHTWSFHALDLPVECASFVDPLVSTRWPGYLVRFPGMSRRVSGPYASIRSDRFSDAIVEALAAPGRELRTKAHAVTVGADRVELADGSVIEGSCVIDARGPLAPRDLDRCGYQKFLGLEVLTDRPWPDDLPTMMNANVPQDDGYRFTYVLPFGPRRVLVEDTYFSDTPALNRERSRHRVAEHLEASGVGGWRALREEFGVLPMPWHDAGLDRAADDGPITSGFGGGWFHPATGYSFPMAVRLANIVAQQRPDGVRRAVRALAGRMRARRRFALFLNFLMFRAVVPGERWQIFRRLYRDLPDEAMARFYAMEFTAVDAARILVGWPPPLAPLRLFQQLEVLSCPSVSS